MPQAPANASNQLCNSCATSLTNWQEYDALSGLYLCQVCFLWNGGGNAQAWGVFGPNTNAAPASNRLMIPSATTDLVPRGLVSLLP